MQYTIKKLSRSGLAYARQLYMLLQIDDGIENPSLADDKYLAKLLTGKAFHVIVALNGKTVIGGLTAYELPMYYKEVKEMFLYEIAVHKDFRKQGIGAALVNKLKDICREKGIKIMFVGTETRNLPAKQLYLATGGAMEIIPWFTYTLPAGYSK
jgi:aminoglycoside 3-N-acetyltransferase I